MKRKLESEESIPNKKIAMDQLKEFIINEDLMNIGSLLARANFNALGIQVALDLAVQHRQIETVEHLITNYHANINQINKDGDSALHIAAQNGHFALVEFLIDHGVDINQVDIYGRIALITAAEYHHITIVNYLLPHANNPDQINQALSRAIIYQNEYHNEYVINHTKEVVAALIAHKNILEQRDLVIDEDTIISKIEDLESDGENYIIMITSLIEVFPGLYQQTDSNPS